MTEIYPEDDLCRRPHCHHRREVHSHQGRERCMIAPCACMHFVDEEIAELAREFAEAPPTFVIELTAEDPQHLLLLVRYLSVLEMGTPQYDEIMDLVQRFHRWRVDHHEYNAR